MMYGVYGGGCIYGVYGGERGDGNCMVVVQLLCVVLGCGSSHCLFS